MDLKQLGVVIWTWRGGMRLQFEPISANTSKDGSASTDTKGNTDA